MNRRLFVLGSVSLVSLSASRNVAAQATPVAESTEGIAVVLIERYVNDVLNDGKNALLFDILHPDVSGVDDLYWTHVERYAAEQSSMERSSYRLELVFGDDTQGMGYYIYSEKAKDGTRRRTEYFVIVEIRDGLISNLRTYVIEEHQPTPTPPVTASQ